MIRFLSALILSVLILSPTVGATNYPAVSMSCGIINDVIDITSGENLSLSNPCSISSVGDENTTVAFRYVAHNTNETGYQVGMGGAENNITIAIEFENESYARMMKENGSVVFPPHEGLEYSFNFTITVNGSITSQRIHGSLYSEVIAWNGSSPPPSEASSVSHFWVQVLNNTVVSIEYKEESTSPDTTLSGLPISAVLVCLLISCAVFQKRTSK